MENNRVSQCCYLSKTKEKKTLTRSLHGPVIETCQPSACGRYLVMPTQEAGLHPLERHATHHMVVYYGPGDQKIALSSSTIMTFAPCNSGGGGDDAATLGVTRIESFTWTSEFTEWRDMERWLAMGKKKEYATQQEEEASFGDGAATHEKANSFNRKLPRSMLLEYYTYTGDYLFTKRIELKNVLEIKQVSLSEALSTPNSHYVQL